MKLKSEQKALYDHGMDVNFAIFRMAMRPVKGTQGTRGAPRGRSRQIARQIKYNSNGTAPVGLSVAHLLGPWGPWGPWKMCAKGTAQCAKGTSLDVDG